MHRAKEFFKNKSVLSIAMIIIILYDALLVAILLCCAKALIMLCEYLGLENDAFCQLFIQFSGLGLLILYVVFTIIIIYSSTRYIWKEINSENKEKINSENVDDKE